MGTWGLIQIVVDIFLGLGLFVVAMRISRQPKDDPRLSRGLQLLQAKIAVIEDLSDRTEAQVHQMTALIDQKCREVQNKIELADRHVQLVRSAMERSLEVAKIFQDRIPHTEIIERQNTLKYLQAARLAHQGKSVEEIAQQIDLPKGELEFITKVNREQLMFSEEQLPEWARRNDVSLDFVPDIQPYADGSLPGQASYDRALENEIQAQPAVVLDADENRRRAVVETVRRSHEANHQELLENLQQVQRELDERLGLEVAQRDYSSVFDVPKPPTESLARLGEEFRKVCNEVGGDAQVQFATDRFSFNELMPPQASTGGFEQDSSAAGKFQEQYQEPYHQPPGQESEHHSYSSFEYETNVPLLALSQDEIEGIKRSTVQAVQRHVVNPSAPKDGLARSVSVVGVTAAPKSNRFAESRLTSVSAQMSAGNNARFANASPSRAATPVQTKQSVRAPSSPALQRTSPSKTEASVIRKVQFPKIQVP